MIDYFIQAYNATMENEGRGKRTKNKLDPGGETYSGISRIHHPRWPGWPLIDRWIKEGKPIDVDLMEPMVLAFYREKFWDTIAGDHLSQLSPAIAMQVFDYGVNAGPQRASRWLQMALNKLNRNKVLYRDIVDDGSIGRITLDTLKIALMQRPPTREVTEQRIMKIIRSRYTDHWFDLMERFPEREEFRGIWDRA